MARLFVCVAFSLGLASASDILTGKMVTTSLGAFNLTTAAAAACEALSTSYSSQVLFPNSTNYTAQATDYWDVRADLTPACIFLPTTADQVADAVKTLGAANAQFAVRGGGHMNVV